MCRRPVKIFILMLSMLWVLPLKSQSPDEKSVRDFQLSIFPFLGTDGTQTRNHQYNISLNLFMGLTGGVQGLEAGSFMNITNGNVDGLQVAGFGNVVRNNFYGFQWAGFVNVVNGASEGVHLAGFLNTIREEHNGIKAAGFMNVTDDNSRSVSGAGFMNVTRGNVEGIGGAGFMNVSGGNTMGAMGAGFMNVSGGDSQGVYGAGFGNISAGNMQGIQLAGFMNVAGDVQGFQVAGFLNAAREVEGFQLGFINVSDTISGVPVGFLSITRKGGLRQLELSASDVMYANLSYKIGVSAFYNIFSVGAKPMEDKTFSATGYGIGSRIKLSPQRSFLQLEAHSYQIYHEWDWWKNQNTNLLNEFRALYYHSLHERLQLFGGVVLYNHIYKTTHEYSAEDLELTQRSFHDYQWNEHTAQWWTGARVGITFVIR